MKKSYFLSYVFHTLPFTDDSDASCNSYSNLLGNQVYCIGRRTLVSPRVRDNRPGNDVFYARQLRFQVVDVIDCHAVWRRRGTWEQNTLDDDSFKALMVDWLGNDMFYKGEKKSSHLRVDNTSYLLWFCVFTRRDWLKLKNSRHFVIQSMIKPEQIVIH